MILLVEPHYKGNFNCKRYLKRSLNYMYGSVVSDVGYLQETIKIIQPLLLGSLINYFNSESDVTERDAYLLAAGFGACAICKALTHHPYFIAVERFGMWIRVGCCSLIYKKVICYM